MAASSIMIAVLASVSLLLVLFLDGVHSSPYIIADDRVQSLDVTPMLGRGYSIMTNSYQSTCLEAEEFSTPSYNYDYSFFEFSGFGATIDEAEIAAKFHHSFGYSWLKAEQKDISLNESTGASDGSRTVFLASSMRIERYYATLKEEMTTFSSDAQILLNRQDYIGFFKACGPTYIRSIRRAQEVVAFFLYKASGFEEAKNFASNLQTINWSGDSNALSNPRFAPQNQSLRIIIKGWGIGLSQEGSEQTFVASNLKEYQEVTKFAFKTMTTMDSGTVHIGMAYGMEVLPWVYNVHFQVESNILDQVIEIPLAHSLIPRAFRIDNPLDNDCAGEQKRLLCRCKEPTFVVDKYGLCCESASLYDPTTRSYGSTFDLCRPVRQLEPNFAKDNVLANSEFIARLDNAVRYKLNQLATLEMCSSEINSFPDRLNFHVLKAADTVTKSDAGVGLKMTVFELKMALDPYQNGAMVHHMTKELDEFNEMFVQPCYAAIFGSEIGVSADTDFSHFMAFPWHQYKECTKLSCLASGMRWNRSDDGQSGCVASLITGAKAPIYQVSGTQVCSKKLNDAGQLECKFHEAELAAQHSQSTSCWEEVVPPGRIDQFMAQYCMPQLTGEVLPVHAQRTLLEAHNRGCALTSEELINRAQGMPATMSKQLSTNGPGRAVDGDTDGASSSNRAVALASNNPWWRVDLERDYDITTVEVYNRSIKASQRTGLFGVTVKIEKETSANSGQYTTVASYTLQESDFIVPPEEGSRRYKAVVTLAKFGETAPIQGSRVMLHYEDGIREFELVEVKVYSKTKFTVHAVSKGYDHGNDASIQIDGAEAILYPNRGMNVAVIDVRDGTLISKQIFDTHSYGASAFVSFMEGLQDGALVSIAVMDEAAYRLSQDAKDAISLLGSTMINSLGYRNSWCIIGRLNHNSPISEDLKTDTFASCTSTFDVTI